MLHALCSTSPDVAILCNHGPFIKTKKWTLIQSYSLNHRLCSDFVSFSYYCLFSFAESNLRYHIAFGHHISLTSSNLLICDRFSAVCSSWPCHFWKVLVMFFVECPFRFVWSFVTIRLRFWILVKYPFHHIISERAPDISMTYYYNINFDCLV